MPQLELNLKDFSFADLLSQAGVQRLDQHFLTWLRLVDAPCHEKLMDYRGEAVPDNSPRLSYFLLALAKHMEVFLADVFQIEEALACLQVKTLSHDPIFAFKKYYVSREAKRALSRSKELDEYSVLYTRVISEIAGLSYYQPDDLERSIALFGVSVLEDKDQKAQSMQLLVDWCVQALSTDEGREMTRDWSLFRIPQKLDFENLVGAVPVLDDVDERLQAHESTWTQRQGFGLTDERMGQRQVMDEVNYCVYCHKNTGDYCSTGFLAKKNDTSQGFKVSPMNEVLTGCPLEQKISEMNALKKGGYNLAALAMVMRDNPMCAVTGHRICNDCMKACIYQRQEPVDIPQIETRILTDVLSLPWGVELYDLLTRWNPLRPRQYVSKPYHGAKVLVMGMGPAGFSLAYHLLMEGFAVVGADGLKIEPIDLDMLSQPIHSYASLNETLDQRVMTGFGGVAEYGITVRWDKNFLKLVYITLLRRSHFQLFGSVRFGGTLTIEDVWALGFDHLALAVGAGLPKELHIPNSLAPGMRHATDFLMALQLTGAAKVSSLANLQVRLPAVVIGGGLTGVDAATELQAYYLSQIEKISERYHVLCDAMTPDRLRAQFSQHDLHVLDEFLRHAVELKHAKDQAKKAGVVCDTLSLLRSWGGVTIAYRKSMQESPAYKRNHSELKSALEEGVYYAEGLEPKAVILDDNGHVCALDCCCLVMDEMGRWIPTDDVKRLAANTIMVATGAKPNVAYAFEHQGDLHRNKFEYQRYEMDQGALIPVSTEGHIKMENFGPFTSYEKDHYRVSFLGDAHAIFHGSVVKAVASAKRTYPAILEAVLDGKTYDNNDYQDFSSYLHHLFSPSLLSVTRLNANVVELLVRAPMAARKFMPGQIVRLQNFETQSKNIHGTLLQMEALSLIGIPCSNDSECLRFIVVERGASSQIASTLSPQPISLMGPSGVRTKIPEEPESQLFVGGLIAIAHLLSVGPALVKAGCRLRLICCLESAEDLYHYPEIQSLVEQVIVVLPTSSDIRLARHQDHVVNGSIQDAFEYLVSDPKDVFLTQVRCVSVIGSANILRQIQSLRSAFLQPIFSDQVAFIASVYGPMQCMMKGICAQCLQWQIDPVTGKRTKAVYACSWHNQPMDKVDIDHIDERLAQNQIQEKLSSLWVRHMLSISHVLDNQGV